MTNQSQIRTLGLVIMALSGVLFGIALVTPWWLAAPYAVFGGFAFAEGFRMLRDGEK